MAKWIVPVATALIGLLAGCERQNAAVQPVAPSARPAAHAQSGIGVSRAISLPGLSQRSPLAALTSFEEPAREPIGASTPSVPNYYTLANLPVFDVRKYGAKPNDSADDLPAINAAIVAANNASATLGTSIVLIPPGTYMGTPSGTGTFIVAKSNVHITGGGTVKVSNSSGNFKALLSQGVGAVTNFVVDGINFDMNPTGNSTGVPAVGSAGTEQYAIYLNNAPGAKVRNCRFDPCQGINTVVITGKNSEVTGNYVHFVPRITTALWDNSAFYLSGPDFICSRNIFETAIGSGARGACEIHEAGGAFTSNVVDGFQTMVNVVGRFGAEDQTSNSHVVSNNVGRRLNHAVTLWSITGKVLTNTVISNNTLEITQVQHAPYMQPSSNYSHGVAVVWDATCQGSVDGLAISGNLISFESEGAGRSVNGATYATNESLAAGIRLTGQGPTRNATCTNNVIVRAPGPGIRVGGTMAGTSISQARIANNLIVDAGQNALFNIQAYRAAFNFEGVMNNVMVESNTIHDTGTPSPRGLYEAVQYGGTYAGVDYQNNKVSTTSGSLSKSLSAAGLTASTFVTTGGTNTFTALNTFQAGANFGGPPSTVANTRIGSTYAPSTTGSNGVIVGQMIASPTANSGGVYYGVVGTASTGTGNAFNFTNALVGVRGNWAHQGSGTVTDMYAFEALAPANTGGGLVTNGGGIRIAAQNIAGVTNPFAINQQGTTDINLFSGTVRAAGALNHTGTTVGFYNATPVAKAGATNDLKASLVSLGLVTGSGATPLNLNGGTISGNGSGLTNLSLAQITDAGTAAGKTAGNAVGNVPLVEAGGKLNASIIPGTGKTWVVADQTAMLALSSALVGDFALQTGSSPANQLFYLAALPASNIANWTGPIATGVSVASVNGLTGAVTLTTANIAEGAGNLYYTTARTNTDAPNVTLNAAADSILGLTAQQLTLDTQSANLVWAGPASGIAATPTFRSLAAADIPSAVPAAKIGGGAIDDTEFSYLNGVTSAIQGQLDGKAALVHTHDDRYFTETESDARFAPIVHTHTVANVTNLQTLLDAKALASTTVSTTAPLTGGGDLSANRTLGINAATTAAAGSMSAADKTKLNGLGTFVSAGTITTNYTPDVSVADTFEIILGAATVTVNAPTNPTDGRKVTYRLRQDASGNRAVAWNAVFSFGSDITSTTLTTTAGKVDYVGTVYDGTTSKWHVVSFVKGY